MTWPPAIMQSLRPLALRVPRSSLFQAQSITRQAATSSRTATIEQDKSSKRPLRLMPLGGSITYGIGSTDGNGYRKALYDMLVARGHAVEIVGSRNSGSMLNNANEGWPGRRIDQLHSKALKPTAKLLPNIFTVNAGSNDCLQDYEIDSAGDRLDAMLEDLWKTGLPDATVVLSTLVVAADATVNERVLRVNEQIRKLVELKQSVGGRRVFLADMYSSAGPQVGDLVEDGIHPNDCGYDRMASIWADSIEKAARAGVLL